MKQIVYIIMLLILSATPKLLAQISIGYIPFQSVLIIATDTEKLVWAELKMETNTFASNLNLEISPKINFKRRDWVNYYAGVGIGVNPVYAFSELSLINGYFVDFGARIKPLAKFRNFQIIFEISPYVNQEFKSGNIRTRLGIAWNYIRSKKS